MRVLKSKLLVAISLLTLPCATAVDQKHKQPMNRHAKKFTAFAYTSDDLTVEGKDPIAGHTIAADPRVLPLGSRVRVSGAGAYSGVYRVGDVGGKIKGRKVDIFVEDQREAVRFGRRAVMLTVLSVPRAAAPDTGTRSRRCDDCGGTTHLDDDKLSGGVRQAAADAGFETSRPVIEVRGKCGDCS